MELYKEVDELKFKIDWVRVNSHFLFIYCVIFLSQLTLSICVSRWSWDLSRGSRCESRWGRWCL